MHRITYAGSSILTGSEIAHALLAYAQALAVADTSATIEIPTVEDDGSIGKSELLVGPASQLIADAEDSSAEELVDDSLVGSLRAKARDLRAHGASSSIAQTVSAEDFGASGDASAWDDYRD
ncbi:hypothetical protein CVS47_01753 [Microbacterium lemovicicum]|uniref:Uncharacterized protein n=1 Tax=Microbacterium lemovicicum TaxID=1072463 RepID=A0A3Q9J192_9MICO|nr:hypothetical protein [Microbacterium lemovicicum]AZS37125.1 hypothetical protein CVS47_01753 [Microbacterium lemovicicum]